jgi:hypothetical protein
MEGTIRLDPDVRGDLDLILDLRRDKWGGRESRDMIANRHLRKQNKIALEELGWRKPE